MVSEGPVPYWRAVAEMSRLVHPGRAYRDAERQYLWSHEKNLERAPKSGKRIGRKADRLDEQDRKDQWVRQGAERMVKSAIWTQVKAGHIEIYLNEDGEKMIRKGARPWAPAGLPPQDVITRQRRYLSPWTEYIKDTVRNGPVEYRTLVRDAAMLVPEDRARNEYNAFITRQRERRGHRAAYDVTHHQEKQLRLGAEQVVINTLRSTRLADRISIDEEDGVRIVSLGPNPWPWD